MPNGNYTYTVDYVFRLDGGIDVVAGATGTLLTRGVDSASAGNAFGTLVAPFVAAPSHQHFFNFRVDFDVDGVRNRLVQADTRTVPSAKGTRSTPMSRWSTARASATPPRPPTGAGSWKARRGTARSAITPPTNCGRT